MNAAEKLARKIARVTVIKGHYEALLGMPNVIVAPQINMMQAAIERGMKAAGSNDALQVLASLQELEGYQE